MNEEDTGIEKQIISMIKNVLVDEDYEDEKKNDKEVKFNFKLLDLSSPIYQRKEKRPQPQADKNLFFQQSQSTKESHDATDSTINLSVNDQKKANEYFEISPKGLNATSNVFPSQNNSMYTNFNNNSNNSNNSNVFNHYDYQNLLMNNSLNSTSSGVFIDNNSGLRVKNQARICEETPKLINESENLLESKMLSIESIDEEIYEKFKGRFLEIITNQNCSRILQNCLHTIPQDILSKILREVNILIYFLGRG